MINSCDKGKRAERAWAKVCRNHGYKVRRGQQHSGLEGEDCVGLKGIWQEVKWDETITIEEGMAQSVRDCILHNQTHIKEIDIRIPMFAFKRNYRPWKVIMRLPDLALLHGGDCKRDLSMVLVEMDAEHWFRVYGESGLGKKEESK